jgi:signal peptidase II
MNITKSVFYCLALIGPFLLDRISKYYVARYLVNECPVTYFFSLERTLNRGVSWGMLYSHNPMVFVLVGMLISVVVGILAWYTFRRWYRQKFILGELLVLSGALSNLVDRVWYGGVLDFMLFYCHGWSFPVFNVADIFIVVGVGIMFITSFQE